MFILFLERIEKLELWLMGFYIIVNEIFLEYDELKGHE